MLQIQEKQRQITLKSGIFYALFVLIFSMASCGGNTSDVKESHEWCTKKADTLWQMLTEVRKNFTYEMDEITERKAEIDSNVKFLEKAFPSGLKGEEASFLRQYKSILIIYNPLAPQYKSMVLGAEDLFFQVKTLREEVSKGIYDKNTAEFKKTWNELNSKLNEVYKKSTEFSEKLKSVEPIYIRVGPKIDEIIERVSG